jgi:diguanylate cyclase (GGDEF)-like protein
MQGIEKRHLTAFLLRSASTGPKSTGWLEAEAGVKQSARALLGRKATVTRVIGIAQENVNWARERKVISAKADVYERIVTNYGRLGRISTEKARIHRIRRSIRRRSIVADPEHSDESNGRSNGASGNPGAGSSGADDAEANQTQAEGDQTLSDLDQTRADDDQTAADGDEAASTDDQAAADDDQAASDRDLAAGGDPAVHDSSQDVRERTARQRSEGDKTRAESALTRDSVAEARDLAAAARDRAAALIDQQLDRSDRNWVEHDPTDPRSEEEAPARANRQRAAADRASAAQSRIRAAADREQAARDRVAAADDRRRAHEDREALLRELAVSQQDSLTGARTRGPGLEDLDHEIDRARRTTEALLAVAYVDVVGLKEVNNTRGHAAGDELLKDAVRVIRTHLRSYDVIIRVGGDEFVCVLSGAGAANVRERFESIQAALATDAGGCEIKVGVASLTADDSATALIDRADADMQLRPV